MNILVFLAGVTVGWAADRLYNTYTAKKMHDDEGNDSFEVAAEEKHDDLTQIKGVGPKLAAALDVVGIHTYAQLSRASADTLSERLQETGGRFNRTVISDIIERAKQVAEDR